jgi:branched-chain amino acid aminotransferase
MSRLIHKIASLIRGIASLIIKSMIRTWKITKNKLEEIYFADASSLDAITRQLPDGYYSTFRTYDRCTRVLGLSAHLRRLPNLDASSLRRQLLLSLELYRPGEARVRVMMTMQGQVYISIEPLKLLPREVYEKGVRVETTEMERDSPRIKSTAFISASDSERQHLAKEGIFEALLVKNGRILEGMTSNFFYVSRSSSAGLTSISPSAHVVPMHFREREVLCTAQRDILLGVTRRTVIHVARGRGLEMRYSPLKLDQLSAVNEAFITSSSRGVVPVIQIDDVTVGQGSPGQITKMLMSAYEEYVLRRAEKI